MMLLAILLSVLSIWDYPSRQQMHDRLRGQFLAAMQAGDVAKMEASCRKGVELLPDDPTWRYNLACSLAHFPKRQNEAFEELEKAIDLGFRNSEAIAADSDLKLLAAYPRHAELVQYAKDMSSRPLLLGPMASVEATGVFGKSLALGEQNFSWDFDFGCFEARMKLAVASAGGNTGDLYQNRDGGHSMLKTELFPGLTTVRLDHHGRERQMDMDLPNMLFPYPVFGNSSRAFVQGAYWRSMPRAMLTTEVAALKRMVKFYLSNQTWVFPANADIAPVGTNGDVFASIAPYWIVTAGRSYSDQPYLQGALEASRAFSAETKQELVRRGLLAPTIQTLMRKSLAGVTNETDYLTARAHPTAFPVNGLELPRLAASARQLAVGGIPPLAVLSVKAKPPVKEPAWPECTYGSVFAWAFVLRADDAEREFVVSAQGAAEYAFVQTHGTGVDVRIERLRPDAAKVTVRREGLSPTNRVDLMVCGRNPGTGWGAPSYVSFARMDSSAPYSDPALTILGRPAEK